MKLSLLAEETDFLVVDKPAGLLVHPTNQETGSTLVDFLLSDYPSLKSIGENPERPGIVHRLDREVSGLMVIPKTQVMFVHLKKQFAEHQVKKEYLALVHGRLPKEEGEINFVIARSRRGGRMAARPPSQEGREARTRYEVEQRFPQATLARVFPETGRTHQIRAHFHALGHPLVGDRLYRLKKQRRKELQKYKSETIQKLGSLEIPRLMLHATKLSFLDLAGQVRDFTSPLPPEFKKFLDQLSK